MITNRFRRPRIQGAAYVLTVTAAGAIMRAHPRPPARARLSSLAHVPQVIVNPYGTEYPPASTVTRGTTARQ
jgi:hypothetical protein